MQALDQQRERVRAKLDERRHTHPSAGNNEVDELAVRSHTHAFTDRQAGLRALGHEAASVQHPRSAQMLGAGGGASGEGAAMSAHAAALLAEANRRLGLIDLVDGNADAHAGSSSGLHGRAGVTVHGGEEHKTRVGLDSTALLGDVLPTGAGRIASNSTGTNSTASSRRSSDRAAGVGTSASATHARHMNVAGQQRPAVVADMERLVAEAERRRIQRPV